MNKNLEEISKEIDKILEQIVSYFKGNGELLANIKNYVEKNSQNIVSGKIELKLIIDMNILMDEISSYVKIGNFFLLKLTDTPFLKFVAPRYLEQEVKNKTLHMAELFKISEDEVQRIAAIAMKKLNFVDDIDKQSFCRACKKIAGRDLKDVPYLALYFSSPSHGIITRDKDIISISELNIWKDKRKVGKIVTIFEKGTISLFVIAKSAEYLSRNFYLICASLFKFLGELFKKIANLFLGTTKVLINGLKELPPLAKTFIGCVISFLILCKETREVIMALIKEFLRVLKILAEIFIMIFKMLGRILEVITGISATVLYRFFEHFDEAVKTIKELNTQPG